MSTKALDTIISCEHTYRLFIILKNVYWYYYINVIFEMILWKERFITMIYIMCCYCRYVTSNVANGNNRNRQSKRLLSKYYCERKMGLGVQYNSFLWEIRHGKHPPTYLFGTVHAPYDLVWRKIPTNAKDALTDATHVFTEVNLRDEKVINAIRKCRQLPKGKTLKDVLPKKLFRKFMKNLKHFQRSRKRWLRKLTRTFSFHTFRTQDVDIYRQYERLKPVWMINLILQQWNKFFVKSQLRPKASLDSHIVDIAQEIGTYRGGIEDVSSHCDPMDRLSDEKVHLALNVTLHAQEMKTIGQWKLKEADIRRVVNLYKCGNPLNTSNLVSLFTDFIDENTRLRLHDIDEYLSRELVYKRNLKMADSVDDMLKMPRYQNAKMFFAVGAAHLLGENSVVTLLREKGYSVRHIKPNEEIEATIERKRIEEETNNIWEKAVNKSSSWVPKLFKKDDKPNIIIFNTEVKKTYVYYYNSSSHPRSSSIMFSILLMVSSWYIVYVS